jgi:hypothetical protein
MNMPTVECLQECNTTIVFLMKILHEQVLHFSTEE